MFVLETLHNHAKFAKSILGHLEIASDWLLTPRSIEALLLILFIDKPVEAQLQRNGFPKATHPMRKHRFIPRPIALTQPSWSWEEEGRG